MIKITIGNAKFRSHDNEGAIRIYTESIIIAPEYGPELCLGYGNRSAALYHAGQYQGNIDSVPPRISQLITYLVYIDIPYARHYNPRFVYFLPLF